MNKNKSKHSKNTMPIPLQPGILKALTSMRKDRDAKRRYYVASNMLNLGNLIVNWKSLVGKQLATKTYPSKLIHGRLYLIVSDSQWLQTLAFVKPQILEKLSKDFSHLKIKDIIGKVGIIPEEAKRATEELDWPNWEKEPKPDTSEIKDEELAENITRCYQHSLARMKGLKNIGYVPCKICKAIPTRSKDQVCAQCIYNQGESKRIQVSNLLADMPWLTFEEVLESGHELTQLEFNLIKEQLYTSTESLIKIYGEELAVEYDEEGYNNLVHEITRAIILEKGCMPDQVDLSTISPKEIPNPKWLLYLRTAETRENK